MTMELTDLSYNVPSRNNWPERALEGPTTNAAAVPSQWQYPLRQGIHTESKNSIWPCAPSRKNTWV